jgi:hypothetical protein
VQRISVPAVKVRRRTSAASEILSGLKISLRIKTWLDLADPGKDRL